MSLREQFTDQLKASMRSGNASRTSTLRMILARLKDTDIAARPKGIDRVVDKEEAEIAVIEAFLPRQMDERAMAEAVATAIAETGAASIKDMGKVMAVLRAKHAATLDMSMVGPMVKTRLG